MKYGSDSLDSLWARALVLYLQLSKASHDAAPLDHRYLVVDDLGAHLPRSVQQVQALAACVDARDGRQTLGADEGRDQIGGLARHRRPGSFDIDLLACVHSAVHRQLDGPHRPRVLA